MSSLFTFSNACMLNTGPSCALTVFMRNTSLQIHTSPVEVPENAISSVQPYTAHIIVSVLPNAPMQPFLPISPPPGSDQKQVIRHLLGTTAQELYNHTHSNSPFLLVHPCSPKKMKYSTLVNSYTVGNRVYSNSEKSSYLLSARISCV